MFRHCHRDFHCWGSTQVTRASLAQDLGTRSNRHQRTRAPQSRPARWIAPILRESFMHPRSAPCSTGTRPHVCEPPPKRFLRLDRKVAVDPTSTTQADPGRSSACKACSAMNRLRDSQQRAGALPTSLRVIRGFAFMFVTRQEMSDRFGVQYATDVARRSGALGRFFGRSVRRWARAIAAPSVAHLLNSRRGPKHYFGKRGHGAVEGPAEDGPHAFARFAHKRHVATCGGR
jgi:hypothetical protein